MWDKIVDFFQTYGIKILIAVAFFVVGAILIKIILLIVKKVFEKTNMERATSKFLRNFLKVVLWVLLFMMIFQYIGIPMTGFIAIISAAGLAVSLALQGSLSNLANGVVIISTKPFKEGDYVSIGSVEGTVKEIKMMHTILQTSDNKEVSIPNQTVVESEIINFNKHKTRNLLIEFPVSYGTDIPKAKDLLYGLMINNDMVLLEPNPVVQLLRFDESSIVLRTGCWCATENYWDLKFELMEQVFNEFKRENIEIPFNQMEIRLKDEVEVLPFDSTPVKKRSEDAVVKIVENDDEDEFIRYLKNSSKKFKSKPKNNQNTKTKEEKKKEKLKKKKKNNFDTN